MMAMSRLRLLVVLFASTVLTRCTDASVFGSLISSVTSCDERQPMSIFDDPTASALASDMLAMQHSTRKLGRIDTHHHLVPSFYADYLDKYGDPGVHLPWGKVTWSPKTSLEQMDRMGTERAILSLSTPGVRYGSPEEVRDVVRKVNEHGAAAVEQHPDRFGFFASLPVPDVEASLAEIAYAMDVLNASGITFQSSMHGRYLGDQEYEPLWAELDRRHAVVYVHPTDLPGTQVEGLHPAMVDFLADTTRTAASMVKAKVLSRYKRVKVILSHAGGYVPYQAARIGLLAGDSSHGMPTGSGGEDIHNFYFDTALSGNLYTLPSLMAFTNGNRLTVGTDFPYAPEAASASAIKGLEQYFAQDPYTMWKINRGTAQTLWPDSQTCT